MTLHRRLHGLRAQHHLHRAIAEVVGRLGAQWLKPLREALPAEITYEQIRLVVAWARREESKEVLK